MKRVFAHPLGQTVERQHLFGEVALAGFDDLLRLLVGEAAVGEDDRAAEPFVQYFGFLVEREDRREAETLFVGAQRAKFVAQFFGQHRNRTIDQIDRRAALLGFGVDHRAGLNVVGHVAICTPTSHTPSFDLADREGVVEVLGIFGVDGEGGYAPEVLASGYFLGGDFGGYLVSGFLYGGWIDIRQPEFREDGMHLGGVVSGASQDVDYLTDGVFGFVGPFHHLYDGFVARFAAFQFLFGDEDVVGKRTVSVTRKAYDLATSRVPTKVSLARSCISMTSPSASRPRRLA